MGLDSLHLGFLRVYYHVPKLHLLYIKKIKHSHHPQPSPQDHFVVFALPSLFLPYLFRVSMTFEPLILLFVPVFFFLSCLFALDRGLFGSERVRFDLPGFLHLQPCQSSSIIPVFLRSFLVFLLF